MGIHLTVLDPGGVDSPAGQACVAAVKGSFKQPEDVLRLGEGCEVLTVEIEHINTEAMQKLAAAGRVDVQPRPSTLRMIQDKFLQKQHMQKVPNARRTDQRSRPPHRTCPTARRSAHTAASVCRKGSGALWIANC